MLHTAVQIGLEPVQSWVTEEQRLHIKV